MSCHSICFHGEKEKYQCFLVEKRSPSLASYALRPIFSCWGIICNCYYLLELPHRDNFTDHPKRLIYEEIIMTTYFIQKEVAYYLRTYHAVGRFSRRQTDDIFLIFPRK